MRSCGPSASTPSDRERILAADERFEAGGEEPSGRSTACWPRTGRWCGCVRRRCW